MAVDAFINSPAPPPTTTTVKASTPFNNKQQKTFFTRKKRSKRPRPPPPTSENAEHLALCLLTLAQGHPVSTPTIATTIAASPTFTTDEKNPTTTATVPVDAKRPERSNLYYKCSVCDKAFSSFHALGGHKASHCTKTIAEKPENNTVVFLTSLEFGTPPLPRQRVHECTICHKTFLSGQALGGHKRLHYEGPPIIALRSASHEKKSAIVIFRCGSASTENNSSIVVAGPGPASSSGQSQSESQMPYTSSRGLDLDLNAPPPMEESEETLMGIRDEEEEDAVESPLVRKRRRMLTLPLLEKEATIGQDVVLGS